MQNSIQLPPEEDYITNFIARLATAYRVFTAKKAIVVIDNDLISFNQDEIETTTVLTQIVDELSGAISEDVAQSIAINNLVYGS